MTEAEKLRQQLVEAHKMAALGRLAAGIVHEINTPIGSIFSNNEVLRRSLDMIRQAVDNPGSMPPDKLHRVIETCRNLTSIDQMACERIASVIRGLKTVARVDPSELRRVDLNEIVRNLLKLTQCQFRNRIQVATEFGELPEVPCYPGLIAQALLNLLVNAGDAIDGEGSIRVATAVDGPCARIAIADSGPGIPEPIRSRVFQRGFSTKPIGQGTGLGLAIASEIVEDVHGGSIGFTSETGRGTEFFVRLPLVGPPPPKESDDAQ